MCVCTWSYGKLYTKIDTFGPKTCAYLTGHQMMKAMLLRGWESNLNQRDRSLNRNIILSFQACIRHKATGRSRSWQHTNASDLNSKLPWIESLIMPVVNVMSKCINKQMNK